MKRLVIALAIVTMLGIISPRLPTLAQPIQVPHTNPATATGSLDKAALLLSYSKILNLAASRQYRDAQDILNELRYVDFPDELRYIIDRYHHLYQQMFTTLDELESLLDETSSLLVHHQIHEARQRLDNAELNIQDARFLLEDLEVTNDTLSDRLGVFAAPAANQIKQAHARLAESIERLKELIDRLNNIWQSLDDKYVQMTGLIPTELSLSIVPASVFVGDTITASGRLNGNGKPLAGRKLALTLDNQPITATTASDGSYATNIIIPYIYADTMNLMAGYEPAGDDTGEYLASESPPVTINTMFYRTLLEVSVPEIWHAGLPFTINGWVSSTGGDTDRTLQILLDDTLLAEATVSGQFSLEVTTPEQATTGKHNLTVAITPYERYSGAAETRSINISKLPIYVDAQTPKITIPPNTIRLSGQVFDDLGPIPDAIVSMQLKDSSITTRTSPDGSFTISTRTTLDLSPLDWQELTMTVIPAEPRYATTAVKRKLFTINPLSMELIMLALIAMWILVDMSSRTRQRGEKGIPQAEAIELPALTPTPEPKPRLTGIKGRILSAYRGGLEAFEKIIDIDMAPNVTLREFLKMATLLAPTATGQFAELTTIAEIALYSDYSPREDTATRAEQLAATIKEELCRGTS